MDKLKCTPRKEAEGFVVEIKDHDTGKTIEILTKDTWEDVAELVDNLIPSQRVHAKKL